MQEYELQFFCIAFIVVNSYQHLFLELLLQVFFSLKILSKKGKKGAFQEKGDSLRYFG